MATATRFTDIRLLDETDSTNRVVLEEAGRGAPEGLVVVADRQTAGRGRLDRAWAADAGAGLLVSVLLRPQELPVPRWHLLTAAAGLAGVAACEAVAGVGAELKWPNDLMAGSAKLAGILAEVPAEGAAVVVGMGLNVHGGPPGAAVLDQLAGRRISRGEVLAAWLFALEDLLDDWEATAERYRHTCATVGRRVEVEQLDGKRWRGRAEGIDEDGRLVVRAEDGDLMAISVGDVTHLRTPDP